MNNVTNNGATRPMPAVGNGLQQLNSDFAVANVQKNIGEKTFKKRMARFAHSKSVLTLAVLISLSALLTLFRPYILPVKLSLVGFRVALAVCLWLVYTTGGKRGMGFIAWLPVVETVWYSVMMAFFAAFIGCGVFSMQFLLKGQEDLVRLIKQAGMWAFVPALLALAVVYCVFLFKRHQRLICCNLRDGVRYGFSFDRGTYLFVRNCIIVAVAMPLLYIIRGVFGDFEGVNLLSDGAKALFNYVLPTDGGYWINLGGVAVHSAACAVAAAVAIRYSAMVKRFRQQKEVQKAEEESVLKGVEELKELEAEKEAEKAVTPASGDTVIM